MRLLACTVIGRYLANNIAADVASRVERHWDGRIFT